MARVSEAVNSGEDLVLDDDDQEDQLDKQKEDMEEEEEKSSSGRDIKILSSRLDKTEQSLDSLGSHQLLHTELRAQSSDISDLLCQLTSSCNAPSHQYSESCNGVCPHSIDHHPP